MRGSALLLLMLLVPAVALAELPVAPGLKVAPLAEEMRWNGLDMRVRRFTSRQAPEAVLAWYRERWTERRGGEQVVRWVEASMPPWTILSHLAGDHFQTVQIRPAAEGSEGWLAELPLDEGRALRGARLGRDFPRMRGSEVMNDLRTRDIGQQGAVILLRNRFSVAANAGFYREHYAGRGWRTDIDLPTEGGHVLVFRRGPQSVNITISEGEDGYRHIVANPVSRSLLR